MYDIRIRLRSAPSRTATPRRGDSVACEVEATLPKPAVISIIDDDASVRIATNNLVRSHGYRAHTFASAEDFLQSAHLNDTSCVIADVQMPVMSGVELLVHLRAQGHGMPFIFITAFPEESVRARALRAGAICFLAKPFDGPTLISCLDAALTGRDGGIDK
jgi:FixJ family two-component response regulator